MSIVQQIVLEALLLRARYSQHDLAQAAHALETVEDDPVARILRLVSDIPLDGRSEKNKSARKASSGPLSRDVAALRDSAPERYGVLSRFDQKLRSREVLIDLDDLRHALASLGVKKIEGGRRETLINAVMKALVSLPWDDAKARMNSILGRNKKSTESYQKLANYILQPETDGGTDTEHD